jgi:peroxiredoxin
MEATRRVGVGERLPALTLERVGGEPVALQRTRHGTSVLVLPHADCEACRDELDGLAALADRFRAWDAAVLVVAADGAQAEVLVDAEDRARGGLGLDSGEAAAVVADRFGTVYRVAAGDHDLIEPDEALEEARYMGSLCPECGVPDDPVAGEESWGRL